MGERLSDGMIIAARLAGNVQPEVGAKNPSSFIWINMKSN